MSYLDELNADIYYIVEVEINGEKLYLYTNRVALHFPDMARKFWHKSSARRFYFNSEFAERDCKYRICKFSSFRQQIID